MQQLSKDAQSVAVCFFGFMPKVELVFHRPRIIHPRMRSALDELTEAGLLTTEDDKRGPKAWKATPELTALAKTLPRPREEDSVPLTTK